jgi:hypothetical protein
VGGLIKSARSLVNNKKEEIKMTNKQELLKEATAMKKVTQEEMTKKIDELLLQADYFKGEIEKVQYRVEKAIKEGASPEAQYEYLIDTIENYKRSQFRTDELQTVVKRFLKRQEVEMLLKELDETV